MTNKCPIHKNIGDPNCEECKENLKDLLNSNNAHVIGTEEDKKKVKGKKISTLKMTNKQKKKLHESLADIKVEDLE